MEMEIFMDRFSKAVGLMSDRGYDVRGYSVSVAFSGESLVFSYSQNSAKIEVSFIGETVFITESLRLD